jgi:peroxiredoxin
MKSLLTTLTLAALFATRVFAAENGLPPDARELKLGDAAPDFKLKGIDGKMYTLADFKKAKVLMVVFLSNHCPYSHAAEGRLIPMFAELKAKGLEIVSINPNSPDAVRIDELGYSKYNDGFDDMKLYAKEKGFNFPYLYDGDTQVTSKAYGCLATPHVFLFDKDRKLRYAGRYDDSRYADPATVKSHDTRNAVVEMLAGKPVSVATTKAMGCSTKWLSKKGDVAKGDENWEKTPVTLERIDAAGVAALAKNSSKKLRVINVWATWCAPCVAEFPGFVSLSRRFSSRDFEFISISVNDVNEEADALKFLQKKHAGMPAKLKKSVEAEGRKTNNYLFTGTNIEQLVPVLDPAWGGTTPFTVIIEPGGKIVYRHSNEVDMDELTAKIIDHLTPYYTPEPAQ